MVKYCNDTFKALHLYLMKKLRFLLIGFLAITAIVACKKQQYDYEGHLATDDAIIRSYLQSNNMSTQYSKDESGIYYQIINPGGTEDVTYSVSSAITVNYTAKLLGKTVAVDSTGIYNQANMAFDNPQPRTFALGRLIPGFQLAIVKLRKGGIIKVLIPSPLAYQDQNVATNLPANSILDYTIELTEVQ